jgi:uncharacterized protein
VLLRKLNFILFIFICAKLPAESSREEITFFASKGAGSNEMIPRKGLMVKRPEAPATILILHGFGGDHTEVGPLRLMLKKYNVVSFDFRAHGRENCVKCLHDEVCTIGHDEVYDVFGAVDFIKNDPDLKNLPLIAFGLSMGAATAIEAQALDPNLFDAMFLDTPFATSECFIEKLTDSLDFKILGQEIGFIKRWIRQYAFTSFGQSLLKSYIRLKHGNIKIDTFIKPIFPIKSIKNVHIPICLIVCKNDEKIPYEEVVKLVDEHPGATRLIVTGGRHHCDSIFHMPEEYKSLLNDFVQAVISGEIEKQSKKEVLKFFLEDEREDNTSIKSVELDEKELVDV